MDRAIVLLDIDNCIANDGWRIPRINWADTDPFRRYHEYHQLAPWDACGNVELFTGREERLIILTGRPVHYRTLTVEWLNRHGVRFDDLLMRNNEDHGRSVEVKSRQISWLMNHYNVRLSQIVKAYDDHPDIVDMYRSLGIDAEVRSLHDISAYRNTLTGEVH